MTAPAARYRRLGAEVCSSTRPLLAVHARIPTFDAAIFADTGRPPFTVYDHVRRLEATTAPTGTPIMRVSAGNTRRDALDPSHQFASMPLCTLGPNGERGTVRRLRTAESETSRSRRMCGAGSATRTPCGCRPGWSPKRPSASPSTWCTGPAMRTWRTYATVASGGAAARLWEVA